MRFTVLFDCFKYKYEERVHLLMHLSAILSLRWYVLLFAQSHGRLIHKYARQVVSRMQSLMFEASSVADEIIEVSRRPYDSIYTSGGLIQSKNAIGCFGCSDDYVYIY